LKSFIKESIVYSTGQVLTRIASFLLVPLFTHVFSPEQTGQIYLFYSTLAFLNIISNHGMDAALFKYIGEKKWIQKDIIKSIILYQFLVLFILYAVIILFSKPLSNLIFNNNQYYWIYILGSVLICDSISQRGMVLLRINSKALLYIIISIANILITLSAVYYYVMYKHYEVMGVFHGVFFASFVQFLFIFILVYLPNLKGRASLNIVKNMVKFGLPFLPAGLLFLVTELSDRYFILWFLGENKVGIYSIAYKIGSIPMILISGINLAWQPFYVKRKNNFETQSILGEIGSLILFGFILCLTITSIWLPLIDKFGIISSNYIDSLKIIPIIFIGYLFYTWYILLMPSIFLEEKQNWAPIFRGLAAIINVVLNLTLIPKYGIIGATIATMFAYAVMSGLLYYKNKTWMNIPIQYKILVPYLLGSILAYSYTLYRTSYIDLFITFLYIIISFFVLKNIIPISELKRKMLF